MNNHDEAAVINEMIQYFESVLEKPHFIFHGLPICPFAKKARLQNKIFYKVLDLSFAELEPDSALLSSIGAFQDSDSHEVLLIICPNICALTVKQVQEMVAALNQRISSVGLVAFGGHPHDDFNIQGVYTRREPFINMTVQSSERLKAASRDLEKTDYYQNWSPENLEQIGFKSQNR
jgi:hypothetical protein